MKIPNWAKIIWWFLILGFFIFLFTKRYDFIIGGSPSSTDIVVFLAFIALLVLPLFQEFSIFGVSFKKEIENLKNEIDNQIISLKSEIQNTVNVYTYGKLPSDSELPTLKNMVNKAVAEELKRKSTQTQEISIVDIKVPENAKILFSVRLQIDKEIKRIGSKLKIGPRTTPFGILRIFEDIGGINSELMNSIREVYSICSAAIHGEDVSESKVNFVKDVAPELISYLKNLESRIHEEGG